MYRLSFAPKMLMALIALLLAACAPAAQAFAPNPPLPDDVARHIARLDQLAKIKDGVTPAAERAAWIARQDRLEQIKDQDNPAAERAAWIARQDQLEQIKDALLP